MIIFKEKKNLCGRSLDALAGSRCRSKSAVKPLLDFSFPTFCTANTARHGVHTASLAAWQDPLRCFGTAEMGNCRCIGCWDRFVICIDGIIPTMWQPKQISLGLNWKDFLKLVIDIEQLSLLSYRFGDLLACRVRGSSGCVEWGDAELMLSCSLAQCCRLLVPAAGSDFSWHGALQKPWEEFDYGGEGTRIKGMMSKEPEYH